MTLYKIYLYYKAFHIKAFSTSHFYLTFIPYFKEKQT
jgi:hypothetical protein